MTFKKPAIIDRRKQALGYPGHGVYAKRNKSAIRNIVWHYTAVDRTEDGAVAIKKHEDWWRTGHGWEIGGYHYYISRTNPKIYWNYDLEVVTYGAGTANPHTMHISVEASSAAKYTAEQVKLREALTLWLMQELNLPASAVIGHFEAPGNSTPCPGYSVAQLNTFRSNLAVKYKAGATADGNATDNPQGLQEIVIPPYQAPVMPFKTLKVGDTVTLRDVWSWYSPSSNKFLKSKRENELAGTSDTIVEIMDIEDIGYSRYAYRLKNYNSWILEQDTVQSRADWIEVTNPEDKEGVFTLKGVVYKIIEQK